MPGNHNTIYPLLVENEGDFVGILAYSVYKRQKAETIKRLCEEAEDGELPPEKLAEFHSLSRQPTQLAQYRAQAIALAQSFAAETLEAQVEEIQERNAQDFERRLTELKPSFWGAAWASVVGSFLFVLALGLLIFTIWSFKLGVKGAFEAVFNVTITANPEHPRPENNPPVP